MDVINQTLQTLQKGLKELTSAEFSLSEMGSLTHAKNASLTKEQELFSAEILVSFLHTKFRVLDFKWIAEDDLKKIGECIEIAELYLETLTRQNPSLKTDLRCFFHDLISLRLGGSIPRTVIADPTSKAMHFILANDLHKHFFSLGIKCRFDPICGISLPIEVDDTIVYLFFDDLQKTPLGTCKLTGYRYLYQKIWAFDTDLSGRLSKQFSVLRRAIGYQANNDMEIRPVDHRDPKDWKHKNLVEVIMHKAPKSDYFVTIRRASGLIYRLAMRKGHITQTPKNPYVKQGQKAVFELSEDQLHQLFKALHSALIANKVPKERSYLLKVLNAFFDWQLSTETPVTSNKPFTAFLLWPKGILHYIRNRQDYPEISLWQTIITPWKLQKLDLQKCSDTIFSKSITTQEIKKLSSKGEK